MKTNNGFKVLIFAVMIVSAIAGWQANNLTRYVQEMHRKAGVCDQIQCDEIVKTAAKMETMLPAVKK